MITCGAEVVDYIVYIGVIPNKYNIYIYIAVLV